MESVNTFNTTNGSSEILQHVLALTTHTTTQGRDSSSLAILLLSALGLPGNVLVLAVYVRQMTTSIRVYMFSLAVADSLACFCVVLFLSVGVTDLVTMLAFSSVINTSFSFSMFLLGFVSIERLVAVKRPHTFNMDPQRAKKYVIIITVAATIFITLTTVATLMRYDRFVRMSASCVSASCTFIMITCYTLMAAALLKKVRASRKQVGVLSVTPSSLEGTSRTVIAAVDTVCSNDPGPSNISTMVKGNVHHGATKSVAAIATSNIKTNQAKAIRNVMMLFIITIVFIACWVPIWLMQMGVYISEAVRRSMIANSVVNPFIYGVASAQFREDVRQFYRQTRIKLSACCH